MVINFYGEGCFKLQSGELVILTDPFDSKIGLTPPRLKPNIILKTLTLLDVMSSGASTSADYQITGPGEYNLKNINITGFLLTKESTGKFLKTLFLIEMENLKLCFLGHLSETPEPAILEYLEEIDILFVPAGGPPFIEQKSAVKLVKQLQPKIIIPCFFKIPSLKRTATDLKLFLEEFNGPKSKLTEGQEKLMVKKKDLTNINKTEIIILKP